MDVCKAQRGQCRSPDLHVESLLLVGELSTLRALFKAWMWSDLPFFSSYVFLLSFETFIGVISLFNLSLDRSLVWGLDV
jgi:hypothetical protein